MALTFRAATAAGSGGTSLSVSMPIPASVQVGDLLMMVVYAFENTRGWGGGIANTGTVATFMDASTGPGSVLLNGRLQYQLDDGTNPRAWIWQGFRIATGADTGGPTYTASLVSSPAFGVGVGAAFVAYANPGGSTPIYSTAVTLDPTFTAGVTVTAPSALTTTGSTGTFLFTVSASNSSHNSASTFVVNGDTGDYTVVCLPFSRGGTGVWNPPAALTSRVAFNSGGFPNYMLTYADGPLPSGTFLGRLPLLGAG